MGGVALILIYIFIHFCILQSLSRELHSFLIMLKKVVKNKRVSTNRILYMENLRLSQFLSARSSSISDRSWFISPPPNSLVLFNAAFIYDSHKSINCWGQGTVLWWFTLPMKCITPWLLQEWFSGQEMERTQNSNSLKCHLHKHLIASEVDPVPYKVRPIRPAVMWTLQRNAPGC